MITAYHRPQTLEQALTLLSQPDTLALGGGTSINTPAYKDRNVAVVDLQALGLNHIHKHGHTLEIGATVTLEQLMGNTHIPSALAQAIRREAPLNIRNQSTIAGRLVASDGRSTLATTLLALDAALELRLPDGETRKISLGNYLPLRPTGLIVKISIPLNAALACEQVARTPADLPIVYVALAKWQAGRARLALGGYGKTPLLAMDGTEPEGLETAARIAFHEAGDSWASAEYRRDVAATLAKRCLDTVENANMQ